MSDFIPAPDPPENINAFMDHVLDWDLGEAVPHDDDHAAALDRTTTWLCYSPFSLSGTTTLMDHECARTASILPPSTTGPAPEALICSYANCTHKGRFSGVYELERHISTKHEKRKEFKCPADGCFQKQQVTAFARPDKLIDHLRSIHRQADNLRCPESGCPSASSTRTLEALGIHIHLAHPAGRSQVLNAITTAASSGRRRCPLWWCKKDLPLASFPKHMLTHDNEHLYVVANDLRRDSYVLVKENCPHAAAVPSSPDCGAMECFCKFTAIKIACPVCDTICDDHPAFEKHLDEDHLIDPEQLGHFKTWKVAASKQKTSRGKKSNRRKHIWWPHMKFRPFLQWSSARQCDPFKCPYCQTTDWQASFIGLNHHLDMLAPVDGLKPSRLRILRLYPDFIRYKAVWIDYA